MSAFRDLGRKALEAVITAELGDRAPDYNILDLVNAYVEMFGFVDFDEVNTASFHELAAKYRKLEPTDTPPPN